jgi:small subunit ribosomal protein S3
MVKEIFLHLLAWTKKQAGGKGGDSSRGDRKPFNKGGKPDARKRK